MTYLVFNSGSSSVKAALFDDHSLKRLVGVRINDIGGSHPSVEVDNESSDASIVNHDQAFASIFSALKQQGCKFSEIKAVGHRVIHGGETLTEPTIITDQIEQVIGSMNDLAPLHNPDCLTGIVAARKIIKNCPHVAVFDTGFHATLPMQAKLYALPEIITSRLKLRRFGFHGISHEYISKASAEFLKTPLNQLRIISCHLGNGCSITAVENAMSVETSMGMTPLEGLVMGTRSGDLDPGVVIKLLRDCDGSIDKVDDLLNRESGLFGLTGTHNMRKIIERAEHGDESCRQAINLFTHRARKYIGAYAAVMGGVDVIAFTGGIGENSALIRQRILKNLDFLGVHLDDDSNQAAKLSKQIPIINIGDSISRVKLLVVATDEEAAIASEVQSIITNPQPAQPDHAVRTIPLAVSARHVHLTDETISNLFGVNYSLSPDRPLSQPGQFSAKETVTLVGPRKQIRNVRILGPSRTNNQIEISRTDEIALGIDAPVRGSGDTDNTPGIKLFGPAGDITLDNGVICALRHIHMHPDDAKHFNVNDGDLVEVEISGGPRDLTFSDVLIRVSEHYKLEMHIDTDEANAAELSANVTARIIRKSG